MLAHRSLILRGLLVVAFVLSLVASSAEAQSRRRKKSDEQGDPAARATQILWRRDLSSALAEGASVGKGVLADFTADWCGFCKKLDAETFTDPAVIRAINTQFIPVKVDVDVDLPAKQAYRVSGIPALIFMKPDGKEAHRIGGYVDAETFQKHLDEAVKSMGAIVAIGEAEKMKRGVELARKASAKGNFGSAYGLYQKIVEAGKKGVPEVDEALDKIAEIESAANKKLDEAKQLVEAKDYAGVADLLEEIVDSYAGVPAGDEAERLRDDIMRDADAMKALRTAKAERLYQETQEDLERRRFGLALTRLEGLVDEYADLPVGQRIRTTLTKLQADEGVVRAARDENARSQCVAWLSLARTWAKNSGNARALQKSRDYYQRIIETFPGTSFAKTAQEEAGRLPDESA